MARLHYSQGTGISHEIVVSLDYFIIRTNYAYDANTLLEESGVDITRVKHVDNYPEANVDVYQVLGNFKFQQRDKIKKIVKTSQHPALDYIGSVMQHAATGIYQIYTGNIYLQFQAETPKIVIGKVQEEFNLEQKDLLISTPHAYYMRFINEKEVGREIFNKCNEILKREEVISCYPELIVKRKGLKRKKPEDVIAILDADWSSRMIRLEEAWKLSKGKGVKICIIDDGIDYEKNNIPKLLNRASTLLSLIGPLSPLTNSIFSVVGLLIKSVLSAPGIADQALDSDIIKEINEKGLTKKQLLLASNFEPEPLIKTILDEVVDSQLFSGVNNDGIAPTIGALGLKNGDRYDRPEGEIFLIPDRNVHHFSYFKNEKSVEKIINHMNTN